MKRYGVIGYPLSHSFSPGYFREKFRKERIEDSSYDIFPLESIDELPLLLQKIPELEGLNVTIPYKQSVLKYLDDSNAIPAGLHSCNCISVKDGKLKGYNTDITGFEISFKKSLKPYQTAALVLGNGGAAAAVCFVLEKLGISFKLVSRTLHKGSTLTYADLNPAVIEEHQVIINTTPLGMFPNSNEYPPLPYDFITSGHYLFDLIYNPAKTKFLQLGEQQGALIQNGLEMLVLQAEESWKIWNQD
jgi:shikimate dehydrogenase